MTKLTTRGTMGADELPYWPEELRGMPSAPLRSALFAPIQRGRRRYCSREEIASISSITIIYTGEQLDTRDLAVYEELLHLARTDLSAPVSFTTNNLIQQTGRTRSGTTVKWLLATLSRLAATEIEFYFENGDSISGAFIQRNARREATRMHSVLLDPLIAPLFRHGYVVRDPEKIRSLGTDLSQWLYGFTNGQKRSLTFDIDTLVSCSRSNFARERDFRARLQRAADELNAVNHPISLEWNLPRGRVTIHPKSPRVADLFV